MRRNRKDVNSIVGMQRVQDVTDYSEIRETLFRLMDEMRVRTNLNVADDARIVIKPNICTMKGPETGATVDPLVVKFLAEWFLENYKINTIYVAESDATMLNADLAFKGLGWERIFGSLPKVQLLNLTKDESVSVQLNGLHFKTLEMSKIYMEADYLISVGKLKTNDKCAMTSILKNQFGSLPVKYKANLHDYLNEVIFDLNKVRLPDLCFVDGIIAMEGDGPVLGIPKPFGVLLVGNDPVSTDHVSARIMGIPTSNIPYLSFAIRNGLGSAKYATFGAGVEQIGTKFIQASAWKELAMEIYQSRLFRVSSLFKVLSKLT